MKRIKWISGTLFVALTLVSPFILGAPAQAQAATKTGIRSALHSSAVLGLADRSAIQLDEGEQWLDGENLEHYYVKSGDEYVNCNNTSRNANVVGNHYGLNRKPGDAKTGPCYGHAWAFSFNWHSDKGAYSIKNSWAGEKFSCTYGHTHKVVFKDCTYKYLNLTGKKTKNHVKIQSWGMKNPQKKAEQLFWISKGPNGYRLWSALAGRPLGYTSNDHSNLKTLDNGESNTAQYFSMGEITWQICQDADADEF